MIALRAFAALVTKEVLHHGPAFFGLAIWSLLMVPLAFVAVLGEGGTNLMSGATGLTYYYLPFVAIVVVGRLVVTEREDRTVEFMNALPATLSLRLAAKGAVGLPYLWGLTLAVSCPLMALSALREFVTLGWFLQLVGLQLLYTTAWFALCLGIAHTGRFRHWIWMALLAVSLTEPFPDGWQAWTWHAALADPVDLTRHAFPWSGVAVSVLWIAIGLSTALGLATVRGGAWAEQAFRGVSNRERMVGTALVLGLYLTLEVVPEMGYGHLYGWDRLPSDHPQVHHVGHVHDWPRATHELLAPLNAWSGEDDPTRVVLVEGVAPSTPDDGPSVHIDNWDRDEVIVRVTGPVTTGDRARLVRFLLEQRSAQMLLLNPSLGFAYDGLGLYLAEAPDRRPIAELRATVAVARGLQRDDLTDWSTLRDRFGEDVAAGVGAIGLVALEACGDDDAVGSMGRDLLWPLRPETTLAAWRPPQFHSADHGCDEATWLAQWWQRLQTTHQTRQESVRTWVGWSGDLKSSPPGTAPRRLSWTVDRIDPERVSVVVQRIDPLRGTVIPRVEDRFERRLDETSGDVPIPYSTREPLDARLQTWVPELNGHVVSGWGAFGS